MPDLRKYQPREFTAEAQRAHDYRELPQGKITLTKVVWTDEWTLSRSGKPLFMSHCKPAPQIFGVIE